MKKKIFIIFGVILILISAFQNKIFAYNPVIDGAREYMSDMLEDMQNNGEISQELYEDLQKQANTELTKAEMTDKLKENLFFFAVGQYANISQDIVVDSLLSLADIWDYIFWDSNTQSFGFDDGIGDFIKNGLESTIYSPPIATIGNWVPIPVTVHIGPGAPSAWVGIANTYRNIDSAICYLCAYNDGVSYGWAVAYRGEEHSGNDFGYSFAGGPSFNCAFHYSGTVASGYYYNSGSWSYSDLTYYSSLENALADFFGNELSDTPILHDAVIVNDNPLFPSLSPLGALSPNYKEIVINNYNNEYPFPPNKGLNVNYYDYDYNYDVPFWGGQELETLEYPQDIDFPSIEFETIAIDENVDSALESLDGGWIVKFFLVAILLLILGLIL